MTLFERRILPRACSTWTSEAAVGPEREAPLSWRIGGALVAVVEEVRASEDGGCVVVEPPRSTTRRRPALGWFDDETSGPCCASVSRFSLLENVGELLSRRSALETLGSFRGIVAEEASDFGRPSRRRASSPREGGVVVFETMIEEVNVSQTSVQSQILFALTCQARTMREAL